MCFMWNYMCIHWLINWSDSTKMHSATIRFIRGLSFSAPVQTGPEAHPASCTMGTGSFLGVKSDRGVMLTPHPLLVLWSRKSRAIPLLTLWAVWPVQSLSACTRVHFYVDYLGCKPLKEKLYDQPNKITVLCQHYCMVCKILSFPKH